MTKLTLLGASPPGGGALPKKLLTSETQIRERHK